MKRLLLLFLLLPLWYASTAQEWLPLKARAEADTTLKSSPAVCLVDRTNVQIAETGSGAFDIYRAVLIGGRSIHLGEGISRRRHRRRYCGR